jgi:Fe-S-cluster-containing hydrogenase component 2
VEVCPEDVFIKMGRTHRHHIHVRHPDACTECKKCVRACEYDAIEYLCAQVYRLAQGWFVKSIQRLKIWLTAGRHLLPPGAVVYIDGYDA